MFGLRSPSLYKRDAIDNTLIIGWKSRLVRCLEKFRLDNTMILQPNELLRSSPLESSTSQLVYVHSVHNEGDRA